MEMQAIPTEEEIRRELERLAPFHHRVELPYGLTSHLPDRARRKVELTRVDNLVAHAFPALLEACGGSFAGQRVLDVACNCGGFSVEAAKRGAEYVLGFDIVDRYLEQARFIKRCLGLEHVDFEKLDLRDLELREPFDVTFCFGILYHLEDPIGALRRIARATKHIMVIDTTVIRTPFSRRPLWLMQTPPVASASAIDATTSLWRDTEQVVQLRPNAAAVRELLQFLGFVHIERLRPRLGRELRYYTGRRVTFLARRA